MKKAFTLVELLVVVGIIGILIGVLLGTFGGAGESARAAKCMANMHNLALAMQSYAMGSMAKGGSEHTYPNSGKWLPQTIKTPYDTNTELWNESLEKLKFYTKALKRSRECYVCPTHQKYAREHNLGGDPLWSYAMNSGLSGASFDSLERADHMLLLAELPYAQVKNGEFEQTGSLSGDELDGVLICKDANGTSGGNEVIGFNHKKGKTLVAHICYADGHVAKLVAPKSGDIQELTMWLCHPTDSKEGDIDISFDGTQYKKITTTEE